MADLFQAAAERRAIASGRPVSQELLRVRGHDAHPSGPLLRSRRWGTVLGPAPWVRARLRCATLRCALRGRVVLVVEGPLPIVPHLGSCAAVQLAQVRHV